MYLMAEYDDFLQVDIATRIIDTETEIVSIKIMSEPLTRLEDVLTRCENEGDRIVFAEEEPDLHVGFKIVKSVFKESKCQSLYDLVRISDKKLQQQKEEWELRKKHVRQYGERRAADISFMVDVPLVGETLELCYLDDQEPQFLHVTVDNYALAFCKKMMNSEYHYRKNHYRNWSKFLWIDDNGETPFYSQKALIRAYIDGFQTALELIGEGMQELLKTSPQFLQKMTKEK